MRRLRPFARGYRSLQPLRLFRAATAPCGRCALYARGGCALPAAAARSRARLHRPTCGCCALYARGGCARPAAAVRSTRAAASPYSLPAAVVRSRAQLLRPSRGCCALYARGCFALPAAAVRSTGSTRAAAPPDLRLLRAPARGCFARPAAAVRSTRAAASTYSLPAAAVRSRARLLRPTRGCCARTRAAAVPCLLHPLLACCSLPRRDVTRPLCPGQRPHSHQSTPGKHSEYRNVRLIYFFYTASRAAKRKSVRVTPPRRRRRGRQCADCGLSHLRQKSVENSV